jgi:inorganic pyrophosphatase
MTGDNPKMQTQINQLRDEQTKLSGRVEEWMERFTKIVEEKKGQIDKWEDKLAAKLGEKEEVMALRVADLVTNALRKKKPSIRG